MRSTWRSKRSPSLTRSRPKLVQEINMLNQKFTIKGRYLKAPNSRIYLLLTVTGLPDTTGTSLQVCDGETLWDYQVVLDSAELPQAEHQADPGAAQLAGARSTRSEIRRSLDGARPDRKRCLMGLRRTLKFDQKEEDELDGKKVWRLRGTWRTRQGLVSPDGRPVGAGGFLPPYIPMDGTLYLGKDDGWPYKLVLMGESRQRSLKPAAWDRTAGRSAPRARSRKSIPAKSG